MHKKVVIHITIYDFVQWSDLIYSVHCPLSWRSGLCSHKLCRTYDWKACIWELSYNSAGNSSSLNLWQVDLFGLAMAMAMPVSFTLLEMNDNSQKCLSNTLSVSLNFWTSFPVVLREMAALPKWYALKSSAIHCYYQPFHLHSSISSIHSFFINI